MMPTYEVLKGTIHQGFVTAVSYEKARAKAVRLYGPFVDVELAYNRAPRPSDRKAANVDQTRKTARRYPAPGFEERRAALIAAHSGE